MLLQDRFPEVELPHQRVDALVISIEITELPFQRGGPFCILLSGVWKSPSRLSGVGFLPILIGMKWELAAVLICVSLLGRVEHLFKCIRAISLCELFTAFAHFSVAVLIFSSSGAGSSLRTNKIRPSLMI